MSLRWIGAFLVGISCTAAGFQMSAVYIRNTKILRSLIYLLERMSWELSFRHASLPDIFDQMDYIHCNVLKCFFHILSEELRRQISPNVAVCTAICLERMGGIPPVVKNLLLFLGDNLGMYDLESQLKGISEVRNECTRQLELMEKDQSFKIKMCRTFGVCTGAVLSIILM